MSCACGPDWLPDRVLHWYLKVPMGEPCFFHEACKQHDLDYEAGVGRDAADLKFLISMMEIAILTEVKDPKMIFRANAYFRWVRWFGWVSYYYLMLKRRRELWQQ